MIVLIERECLFEEQAYTRSRKRLLNLCICVAVGNRKPSLHVTFACSTAFTLLHRSHRTIHRESSCYTTQTSLRKGDDSMLTGRQATGLGLG